MRDILSLLYSQLLSFHSYGWIAHILYAMEIITICLEFYDNKSLWQRAGFLFSIFRKKLHLSADFFRKCKMAMGNNQSYIINKALSAYSEDMGYRISDRSSFVLDSKSLLYTTTTGSVDKIKLDINYHSRCHVYPAAYSDVSIPFDMENKSIRVAHLNIIELFTGKIKALFERCKPRDI